MGPLAVWREPAHFVIKRRYGRLSTQHVCGGSRPLLPSSPLPLPVTHRSARRLHPSVPVSIFFCLTALASLGLLRLDEPRGISERPNPDASWLPSWIVAKRNLTFQIAIIQCANCVLEFDRIPILLFKIFRNKLHFQYCIYRNRDFPFPFSNEKSNNDLEANRRIKFEALWKSSKNHPCLSRVSVEGRRGGGSLLMPISRLI